MSHADISLSRAPGHEGLQEVLQTIDSDLAHMLQHIYSEPALQNTITLLVSDHGNHMSPWFYFTGSGFAERSLPALHLVMPHAFLARVPRSIESSLYANQQALLGSYDLYATFHHLHQLVSAHYTATVATPSDPQALDDTDILLTNRPQERALLTPEPPPKFAFSLFDTIPRRRGCDDAFIPEHTCVCERDKDVEDIVVLQ